MTQTGDFQPIRNRFAHLITALNSTLVLARNDDERASGRLLAPAAKAVMQDIERARDVVGILANDLNHAIQANGAWDRARLHAGLLNRALALFISYLNWHVHINAVDGHVGRRRRSLDQYGVYERADLALYVAADLVVYRAHSLGEAIELAAGRASRHPVTVDLGLPTGNKYVGRIAHDPAGDFATASASSAYAAGTSPTSRVLAAWAVRVLPSGERARYREEFGSELSELRTMPRRMQVAYGMRLLVRSLGLRRSLSEAPPSVPVRES